MAGKNDENLPFVQFPDVASYEKLYDYRTIGFCYERALV